MAATIKIKNSSTAGAAPTSSDLVQGELAVNVTDKRLFTENASGTIVELGTNPSVPVTFPDGSASAPSLTNDGDTNTGLFFPAADTIALTTGGTERLRLDSSGNLGLGTTSPVGRLDVSGGPLTVSGSLATDLTTKLAFECSGSLASITAYGATAGSGAMRFITGGGGGSGGSERARIASNGQADFYGDANSIGARSGSAAGTSNRLFFGTYGATSTSTGTISFTVWTNGNVVNTNNSYGAISDIKLKENIEDATPKLAQLCQVRVVNYNFKEGQTQKQLGVIAQELEQVFPSMVEESPDVDAEGNDLGTTTKSVKYSVFVPMLIKAIQEQQAIITQLQADVAALKG